MQKLYAILYFVFCINFGKAQNLVLNSGFDTLTFCGNLIDFASPWTQPSGGSSADVFNACASTVFFDTPQNFIGFQIPRSQSGYSGIYVYINPTAGISEYIEIELNSPLISDKRYCVEFYISLADSSYYAIDAIGAVFTDTFLTTTGSNNIYLSPQIYNNSGVISDKINWTKIEGSFIAQGGEKFLTIGNFSVPGSFQVDTVMTNYIFPCYYYIDDVAVYLCDSTASTNSSLIIPNVFSPNGDDVNDFWMPQATGMETMEVTIVNRWGEIVKSWTGDKGYWDGYTFPAGVACNEGTYFYWLKAKGYDGVEYNEKGTITLLK